MTTTAYTQKAGILLAILVIDLWTKPIIKLKREFVRSNPYMKLRGNPIKNGGVRVTMDKGTDRWPDGQAKKNRALKI